MERRQLRGNSMPFQNYSMADDHNVAPGNGNFWAAAGISHLAADNHNRQDADFLAALSNLIPGPYRNPAHQNRATSPYYDQFYSLIGSEFSRLSLTPSAYLAAPAAAQPHLSIRDIQQMRVESAAIYQMGLIGQPQNNHHIEDHNCSNVGAVNFTPHRSSYGRNLNRSTQPRQCQHLSVSGRIFSMAKDQKGCQYLQDKFIEGRPEEIQMIFMEIKDHVCELMVHPSGNYLIQRFVEVCNQDQITQLLMLVTDDHLQFISICNDTHGTRAIQKLLQHLETSDQKYRVISVLRRITVALSENINGSHIIHYCVKNFTVEQIEDILNIVADNCLDMATDQYGCVVLQTCLGEATGVPRDRLLADISSNALMLSENPYGNYVVQYVFGMNSEDIRDNIMGQLRGNFVSLSMNKFGSHVVEKCLKRPKQRQIVMQEIIGSQYFLRVLQDRYGNYVVQVALEHSQGEEVHKIMKNMIMMNSVNLHSHPYGQRVLKKAKGSKSRGTYDCASLTCPFI